MGRLRSLILVVIAATPLLVSAQNAPPPQEPLPTFRVGVRAIQMDAVVTDAGGNPVRGLAIDDFEITERGRPQPITTFEAVDIPIERQLPDLADADVVSNEAGGRIYLIVIDAISAENGLRTKELFRRFFDTHFGPGDQAAVMLLDRGHVASGQDFTSNRRLLVKGIDSFIGYASGDDPERVPPGAASPLEATMALPPRPGSPTGAYEARVLGMRNRMARLADLADFLQKIPGRRKALILVSEAIGFDAHDFADYRGTTLTPQAQSAHTAMTIATRGNIAIYPIHPGGLGDMAGLESTMELRALGAATGGFAQVNSNNYDAAFTRLVQENSAYYMLGFNSAEDRDDGLYVPVQVRTKRPGLTVRARDGYLAPFKGRDAAVRAERRPGVESALGSPIPVDGVKLRAFAAPFKGRGKNASILVALAMDPLGLGLLEVRDGSLRGPIDVRLVATDVRANVRPQIQHEGTITIPASARADVQRDGVQVLMKTDLAPGRHQLRIAVGTAQRGGSVIYDLDVPDFSRRAMAMSGVVLRGPNEPEGVFLPDGDPLATLAVRAPTTAREFKAGDRVSVFVEIYDTTGRRAHTVTVQATVRHEAGALTPVATVSRSSDELKKTGDTLQLDAAIPVGTLAPGRYVLSVEAKSSAGSDAVTRAVPFQVR